MIYSSYFRVRKNFLSVRSKLLGIKLLYQLEMSENSMKCLILSNNLQITRWTPFIGTQVIFHIPNQLLIVFKSLNQLSSAKLVNFIILMRNWQMATNFSFK